MSEYGDIENNAPGKVEKTSTTTNGLVDASSENAPDYLDGNPRRREAEKARQERKRKLMEEEEAFYSDLIDNVLVPKGLVTDKERNFIFLKNDSSQSKQFWHKWLKNYNLFHGLNGGKSLKIYKDCEFHESPVELLAGKMGALCENIFDICFYLEKLARFAADFQTEWKTPHFFIKKNEAGSNILEEQSDTERNQEAEQIVHQIWDLMNEFDKLNPHIVNYYNAVCDEMSGIGESVETDDIARIYSRVFENPRTAKDFEQKRFELFKKYASLLFTVKDNWEKRLERKYDGFTRLDDVENVVDTFLEKRLALVESIYK